MKPRILKVTVGVIASFAAAAFIFPALINFTSAKAQTVTQPKDCPAAGWEWMTGSTPPGSGGWQEGKFYLTPPGPVQEGEANEVVAIADFSHCNLIPGNKYPASLTFTDSNGKTYQVGLRDVDPANPANTEIQWASLIGSNNELLGGSNNLGQFEFTPTITIGGSQYKPPSASSPLEIIKQPCNITINSFNVNGLPSLSVSENQQFNLNISLSADPPTCPFIPVVGLAYFANNTEFTSTYKDIQNGNLKYTVSTSAGSLNAGNQVSIFVKVFDTHTYGPGINEVQSTPVVICYNAPCTGSQGTPSSTTPGGGGGNPSGGSGSSGASATTVGLINPLGSNCSDLNCPIKKVANILFTFAIPIFAILILIGGYQLMTSSGNPESVSKGKKTILYSVVGFIVILLAGSIATLIVNIFGGS